MNMRKILKRLLIALAILAGVLLGGFALLAALFLWTPEKPMGECVFSNARIIVSFWTEEEFDSPGPILYYRIMEEGRVVVPKTYLANHRDNVPFPMQKYATSDGKLLAVTYDLPYARSSLVIYDTVSKESWPRLRDDEVSYTPNVKTKWQDRYARLKREHANLVEESYFTEKDSQPEN
jgi:hypothetical protein